MRNGILHKKWESPNSKSEIWQVIPCNRINQILVATHDSGGILKLTKPFTDKIRKRFYWTSCKQDVENWYWTCKICNAKNGSSGKGKSPLQINN